ncbi:MAG: PAS domain S-box protein [bacterium]
MQGDSAAAGPRYVLAGLSIEDVNTAHSLAPEIDDVFPAGDATAFAFRLRIAEHQVRHLRERAGPAARIEQANDAIYTLDFAGTFSSANAACETLTGYPRELLIGMPISAIIVPEDLARAADQIQAKLTGEAASTIFSVGIRRADGIHRQVEVSSRLLYEKGKPTSLQGIARDITAQREMETQLSRLAAIVESSDFAVIGRDIAGRVTSWNAAAEKMFGWTREEAIGHTMRRIALPDQADGVASQFVSVVSGGTMQTHAVRLRRDGTIFPVRATAFPVYDAAGHITGTASVVSDLTSEEAQARALEESERRYRAAADLSLDAFFILQAVRDAAGEICDFRFIDMNARAESLISTKREDALGQLMCELIPEGRTDGFYDRYVQVVKTGVVCDEEMSIGSTRFPSRWLRLTVVKLGDGVAITARDITEHRREQEALTLAQAQLSAVFESSNEAVLVLSPQLTLMSANRSARRAAERFFGTEAAPGDPIAPWVFPDEWATFKQLCQVALDGGQRTVEWRRHSIDGEDVWLEYSFSGVTNHDGGAIGVAIVARDVTERRTLQLAIEEREAALTAVFASMNEGITLIDPDRRFILGNQIAVERMRLLSGNDPVAGGDMHEYVRPGDWDDFDDLHRRAMAGEHVTTTGRFPDATTNQVTWVEYHHQPVRDEQGTVVAVARVTRDVTDTKTAERALREATRNQRAIVENTPDALFVLDIEGPETDPHFRVAMVNSAFSRLSGLSAELVQGHLVEDVFTDPRVLQDALAKYGAALQAGATITYEEQVPFGRYPHIQTNLTPLADAKGNFTRLIGSSRDITDRKRLEAEERAAREEAERLAVIVESASDAIVSLDMRRHITYWSPGAERVYGFLKGEALGQPISLIYLTDRGPGTAVTARQRLDSVFAGEAILGSSTQRRHKDGHVVDVLVSAFPLRNADGEVIGVASTATDITDRLRAEAAAREGAADLNAVFTSSQDPFILLDIQGRIVSMNPAALEDLNIVRGREDVVGLPWEELMPDEGKSEFRGHFERACAGDSVTFERQTTIGSEKKWFDVTYSAVRLEGGALRGVLISARDITERKRTNETLLQAQKLESLAVLAGGIAHDFNNVLVGILGNAGLALAELSPNSPARPTVEAIELAGQRAAELARQMLAYSGRGKFVIQDADLNDIVREMTHLLRVSIGKRVALRLQLAEELPLVRADSTQLRQVIMNLVVNASDAIGDNEGAISVVSGTVHASRELLRDSYLSPELEPGEYVSVEVTDTGSGMDANTLARIFDPFFTTKFTGRGLGLAAVLGIMRGHGGAIKVESTPGRGTTFRLLLPAIVAEGLATPAAVTNVPWRGHGTVLVVDDEPTVRAVTLRALKMLGFETLEAEDGAAGLEVFAANRESIVAVLLDMTMPRMNGEQTFLAIKHLAPRAQVILMSGYTEQDTVQRFGDSALAGFIQKPYELATLRAALQTALGEGGPA